MRSMLGGFHPYPMTLSTARSRGGLSPTLAGTIAKELREDVMYWVAVAGLEMEKDSSKRNQLLKASNDWRRL